MCVEVIHILPCVNILCVCLGECVWLWTSSCSLSKPHTAFRVSHVFILQLQCSSRRRRAGRHSQVLPGHAGQAWELLLVLLPAHEHRPLIGLCCWTPAALASRHLVRSSRWQKTGRHQLMCYWHLRGLSSKALGLGTCPFSWFTSPSACWICLGRHQRITHNMRGWPPRLAFLLQHG